jgi:hypothetical protein
VPGFGNLAVVVLAFVFELAASLSIAATQALARSGGFSASGARLPVLCRTSDVRHQNQFVLWPGIALTGLVDHLDRRVIEPVPIEQQAKGVGNDCDQQSRGKTEAAG